MKVKNFSVERTKCGVIAKAYIEFDAEIKIDIPMHLDFVKGRTGFDNSSLDGETPFDTLKINTVLIRERSQADKTVKEIKALLHDLEYRETVELNRLLEVEQYLKEQFKDYIETKGENEK